MSQPLNLPAGPFLRSDLTEQGVSRSRFYRLREQGRIRPVVREVYVARGEPDTVETRAAAVALVVAPGHVVVDRTAAAIHGIDVLSFAEHDVPPPVETCVLRGHFPTQRRDVWGRTRDLTQDDIEQIGPVRVTTPLRTSLDLGCHLRRREAFAAMCEFARLHGVSARRLAAQLPRYAGRRGVVQLRELAPLVDARLESPREAWVWLALHDAGLPMPEPQVWIVIDGVPTYRLDFAYRGARVCVEYDGEEFHGRTQEQRSHDERRLAWLREHGWTVIVVRAGDFSEPAHGRWLRAVRAALEAPYTTRRW